MSREVVMHALRGATTVAADEAILIHGATSELLMALLERNGLGVDRIISAIFTLTPDLRSEFPARAARDLGLDDVPMICAQEIPVPGALPRCIRVLLHVAGPPAFGRAVPVYLGWAISLRPDLAEADSEGAD